MILPNYVYSLASGALKATAEVHLNQTAQAVIAIHRELITKHLADFKSEHEKLESRRQHSSLHSKITTTAITAPTTAEYYDLCLEYFSKIFDEISNLVQQIKDQKQDAGQTTNAARRMAAKACTNALGQQASSYLGGIASQSEATRNVLRQLQQAHRQYANDHPKPIRPELVSIWEQLRITYDSPPTSPASATSQQSHTSGSPQLLLRIFSNPSNQSLDSLGGPGAQGGPVDQNVTQGQETVEQLPASLRAKRSSP